MHVQFLGLPSSGKSTLVKALIERYPGHYVAAKKNYISIRRLAIFKPALFFEVLFDIFPILPIISRAVFKSEVGLSGKISALLGLVINLANYLDLKRTTNRNEKIILWDELLFQRGLSIFAYSGLKSKQRDILAYAKWADFICKAKVIDINFHNNTLLRLKKRGLPSRLVGLPEEKLNKIMVTHQYTLNTLVSRGRSVASICSDNSLDFCIEEIHSRLLEIKKYG